MVEVMGGNLRKENGTRSCGCIKSIGELKISEILSNANIDFIKQYSFENCVGKTNCLYHFDFAIFFNGYLSHLIEFNGRQHYEEIENFFRDDLKTRQERDNNKKEYCKNNNIPLIIIPYTVLNQIQLEDLMLNSKYLLREENEDEIYCDY